ncbi:uncharacterized protein TNCV_3492631 [Trichonephila clavipes]|nr:uncharacterized protein TNCV_3492631 [Trichonephila clavipes]
MALHTITPAVGVVCCCKVKVGLRYSLWGLHTRTRFSLLLELNLDSSLKSTWFHSVAVKSRRARRHSKWRCRWLGVKGRTRNGCHDTKISFGQAVCGGSRRHGAPSKGATCIWTAVNEAVGYTLYSLAIFVSYDVAVCRGRPEPGRLVNDVSSVHWFQHLLTVKSERPT